MKAKVLYLLGALLLPLGFPFCVVFEFVKRLVPAVANVFHSVAYTTKRDWRYLKSYYADGFPKKSDKERS